MNGRNQSIPFPAVQQRMLRWRTPVRGIGWRHHVQYTRVVSVGLGTRNIPVSYYTWMGYPHEKGAPVRVWGYTQFLKETDPSQAVAPSHVTTAVFAPVSVAVPSPSAAHTASSAHATQ